MSEGSLSLTETRRRVVPDLPLIIWMVVITLVLGLLGGLGGGDLVAAYSKGFGRALGEFALILLPAFTIAAVLSRQQMGAANKLTVLASPLAAAGMVCPDTAYAALSPAAGGRKLSMAFGAYAGFRLLFPAGPLIVATALGVNDPGIFLVGLALFIPVWLAGLAWARRYETASGMAAAPTQTAADGHSGEGGHARLWLPFAVLAGLLAVGAAIDFAAFPAADFVTQPKGALIAAAIVALIGLSRERIRECLDSAVNRTGGLLLVIGAASAFGGILTSVFDVGGFLPSNAGILGLISLFLLTVMFKLMQGSSMATFAAVAPIAAPLVLAAGLNPVAAIFAICLGTFVTMLPNESFYWLVRRDALEEYTETRALLTLSPGAALQAITGMAVLLALVALGIL